MISKTILGSYSKMPFDIHGPMIVTCQKCGEMYIWQCGHICIPKPIAVAAAVGGIGYVAYRAWFKLF